MTYCKNCGSEMGTSDNFCESCGVEHIVTPLTPDDNIGVIQVDTIELSNTNSNRGKFIGLCLVGIIGLGLVSVILSVAMLPPVETVVDTPRVVDPINFLPPVSEMGDGTGWYADKPQEISDTIVQKKYHKNNCVVTYRIEVHENRIEAEKRLETARATFGHYEYPKMKYGSNEIGDDSIVTVYSWNNGFQAGDAGDGFFIVDNIAVTVTVYNTRVSERDVSRYGHAVEKLI